MFGSTSRRHCRSHINKDAGSGAISSAGGEDKEEDEEAQGGFHSGGTPGNLSGEIRTSTPKGGRERQNDNPSPRGKKRAASEDSEREASKQGEVSQSGDAADTKSPRKHRPVAEP